MFIIYCKLLQGRQRAYELYLFSVRYSTTFTEEALRGIFAASDDKENREKPYLQSGIPHTHCTM